MMPARLFCWLVLSLLAVPLLCPTAQAGAADRNPATERTVLPLSGQSLATAALERTRHEISYDGRYFAIDYPNGDVPAHLGVCTDVLIRSYRRLGIDLQARVHEDMTVHFSAYPDLWGLAAPDANIDHRRVPNLERYFARHGDQLPLSGQATDYRPGDIVSWRLDNGLPHIGIVSDQRSDDGERPLIVHNIGDGPRLEDMLFDYRVVGHYRYPASLAHQTPHAERPDP